MIRTVRHGLKRLFEQDDPSGINSEHADKLRDILATLNAAPTVAHMDLPGFRLHPLKGRMKGFWAVTVRANWRVIFRLSRATRRKLIMSITTRHGERPVTMKNPPHPGGVVLRQCIEPLGLRSRTPPKLWA